MKSILKKAFLICICFLFYVIEPVRAQSLDYDTLKSFLNYLSVATKDTSITELVNEILAVRKEEIIPDSLASNLLKIEGLLAGRFKPDSIMFFFQKISSVLRELPPKGERLDYARSLDYLGYVYFDNFPISIPSFKESLRINNKRLGENNVEAAYALESLAKIYSLNVNFDSAMFYIDQCLLVRGVNGEADNGYLKTLQVKAQMYLQLNRSADAVTLMEQVIKICKSKIPFEKDLGYAAKMESLASMYKEARLFDKSLECYEEVLAIKRNLHRQTKADYASTLQRLADLHSRQGEWRLALPLLDTVLSITKLESGESSEPYAHATDDLAFVYQRVGQYDKALQLFHRALEVRKRIHGEDKDYYATSLSNVAYVYMMLRRYDEALPLFKQALAIRMKRKQLTGLSKLNTRHYCYSLDNLADLYTRKGQLKNALPLFVESMVAAQKIYGDSSLEYCNKLCNVAKLFHSMQQYDSSIFYFRKAKETIELVLPKEHPDYGRFLNDYAAMYSTFGNYDSAAPMLISASEIELKHLFRTYTSLSEIEKMTLLDFESFQFRFLPSLLFFHADKIQPAVKRLFENELVLKGIVLQDQERVFRSIRDSKDSSTIKLYQQWISNKNFLGRQELLHIRNRVPYYDSLREVTAHLEQRLSRYSSSFSNQIKSQQITSQTISEKLLPGEVAIEFVSYQLFDKRWTDTVIYAALVLYPKDSVVRYVTLCEERELKTYIKAGSSTASIFRSNKNNNTVNGVSKSLYDLVWKPLEQYLSGVHTVYYAPSGLLNRVPFQSLKIDSSHYLIDRFQLNQLMSTRSIAFADRNAPRPVSISLWGDMQYDLSRAVSIKRNSDDKGTNMENSFVLNPADSKQMRSIISGGSTWKALPETKMEIEKIKNIFKSLPCEIVVNSGANATEEKFKELDGKSPQILHLATHGFFFPVLDSTTKLSRNAGSAGEVFLVSEDPMFRSGLILSGGNYSWSGGETVAGKEDGILTAYDIAQMDLRKTDLVVLSACETALGDLHTHEGVMGLQRAFKMAGVKHIIMSVSKVPDKETRELMTEFYRNYIKGDSPRKALRSAQLAMKQRKMHPLYWAAFVLIE
jgi:CHAT domain-containing protein